jgi:hypothetical protein
MMKSDTDKIIWQLAENYDDKVLLELHRLLLKRNLFIPSTDGSIRVAEVSGMKLAVFYTGMHPSWGGVGFANISYSSALEMLQKMNDVDGILLHNKQDSWVGIDKNKALWLCKMAGK